MDTSLLQRASGLLNLPQAVNDLPNPQESVDVTAPAPIPPINVMDRMNQLYHPSNEASGMLQKSINQMPQRDSYKPSGLQRVLATVAGAGARDSAEAFNTSRGIINRPYDEALEDWQNKIKPQEFLTTREDSRNKEQFNIADKTIDNELNARKEKDIFTTKVADLERKISDSEKQGRQWEARYNADKSNHEALLKVKDAQLELERHKAELSALQHNNTLAETTRKHTADIEAEKEKSKNYQARTELWSQYNKDRLAGKDVSTYLFDKDGNLQGKKTVTTGPAGKRIDVVDENGKSGTLPESQVADWLKANTKRKQVTNAAK